MKLLRTSMTLALIGFLSLGFVQQTKAQMSKTAPTIVGVAAENEVFTTLVAAVKAADLVSTLEGTGPFTVFAPTNDAFGKLPDGTVETLLKPENKTSLTGILTYHVVAGKFMAADVVKAIKDNNNTFVVETVQGSPLTLSLKDGKVMLIDENGNMSTVTATDVGASNGVIHVIDTVVMPK
jgi:uncharacterized surface protein with fasciclin (FAS1) repeats